MVYLKPDGVPAQQELRARNACLIIEARSKALVQNDRKSYPIMTDHSPRLKAGGSVYQLAIHRDTEKRYGKVLG